jgi:hypothetical protein
MNLEWNDMEKSKMARYKRFMERMDRKRIALYLYAKAAVPVNAVGVAVKAGMRWWYITPGMPQDKSAWRISHGDEQGPIGHETSNLAGHRFETKYEAIFSVLTENAWLHPRITGYIVPGVGEVEFRGFKDNPLHGIWKCRGMRKRACLTR